MMYDTKQHKTRPLIEVDIDRKQICTLHKSVDKANNLIFKSECLFEVLKDNQVTKIYFDYDKYTTHKDDKMIDAENTFCIRTILDMFDGQITDDDIRVAQRHRYIEEGKFKISFRYYLPNHVAPYCDIKRLLDYLGITLFDTSVYKEKEQLIGCITCCKSKNDTHKLTPIDYCETYMNGDYPKWGELSYHPCDFLIQYVDSFAKFLNLDFLRNDTTPKYDKCFINKEEFETKNKLDFEILEELVMNLNSSRADDYEGWRDVVWGIFNVSRANGYRKKGNTLIHEFSKQSQKYNEDKVEEFMEKQKEKDDGIGLGTLFMWLKGDNEVVFHNIQSKLNPVKKVELNGYSIVDVDENKVNLRDGCKRNPATMQTLFESTNFKVSGKQAKFVEIKIIDNNIEIIERSRKDFLEEYENLSAYVKDKHGEEMPVNFAKLWLKSPTIRTYDNIDFLPPPTKAPKTTFNTWKGFKAQNIDVTIPTEKRAELLSPIYNHMSIICNHHEQSFRFLKYWVADLIQRPGELRGYALCFQSDEGTGKSTFISEFLGKRIIGDLYYWESSNAVQDLFEKHSNAFHNRILVNIDEPKPFDLRNNADRFKSLITNNRQRLENKNQDSRQVNSCARYVISTNNEDVLKISSNDRRFTIIECSNEKIGDEDYFNNLYEIMDNPEVQKAFYDDMMDLNLTGFKWRQERPITEAYIHNLDNCMSPIVRFMAGEVMYYEHCKVKEERVLGSQLYAKFLKLLKKCESKFHIEYIPFNNKLKKMAGIEKKKTMNGVELYISISDLKEYLVKKEKFDFGNFETYEMIEEYDN